MNKKLKWTLIGTAALITVSVIGKVMGSDKKEEKVTVEKVALRTIVETVNASGKIYPEVEVKISPDISGEITELNVQEGDSVKKGQVLARIYADIYALQRDEAASRVSQTSASVENSRAAIEALRANYNQTKLTYERNKKLFEDKVISRAELEQTET
ncbi:MAG: biotin/lipoyl-binding protein, partial [Bacteroidetes bacterium]|nr:biotin/lipoyl-binding protein [Bacteroidota bacterium]